MDSGATVLADRFARFLARSPVRALRFIHDLAVGRPQ
jgi:hypothetical protein